MSSEDVEEAHVEYALSKNQHSLMMEEGRLWQGLAHSDDPEAVESILRSLAEELETKSSLLSESYDRRTHPPTSETYEQSKEILQAMGVPYITPSGPFEAEALAASLVIHGHADYVASEDTVRQIISPTKVTAHFDTLIPRTSSSTKPPSSAT